MRKMVELQQFVREHDLNKTRIIEAIRDGALRVFVDPDNAGRFTKKPTNKVAFPDNCITYDQAASMYGISSTSVQLYKGKGILQGPFGVAGIYAGQKHPKAILRDRKGLKRPEAVGDDSLNTKINEHTSIASGPAGRS